jgi:oxygen-independent coproporphyrinogen-3 oxidase
MSSHLYIHIPFCARKCIYCDFFSVPYDESVARGYAAALCRELHIKRSLADDLKTVFFGGGTPSILPADCFSEIFHCIRDSFILSPAAEISVEMNPGALGERTIDLLLSLGVNRFSIGVQSFRDSELKALGRIHTGAQALKTIESLKAAGVENFGIDLLYGIPGQTTDEWEETLEVTTGLCPSHISAYELTPEKETPLYREIESGHLTMPEEDLVAEMYGSAIDLLSSAGYGHYEISNYARPGFGCLHNLNYWDRGEYIGAGAGAHSFLKGRRFMNTKEIASYITKLETNILPEKDSSRISPQDAAREFLFLGLRKTAGISLEESVAMGLRIGENCRDLIDNGCMETDGACLRLTRKGLLISNTVIITLFERLGL